MTAVQSVGSSYKITDQEFNVAIEQLKEFVAISSVSNPNSSDFNMDSLKKAADFASGSLEKIGFSVRHVTIDGCAPFVLAEKIVDPSKPTVIAYGHYDLQPVDRPQWKSDPYVLTERDGRLYGRGASDDKGGIIAIVTALGAYQKAYGALPVNMKILFEGEEEFGSTHMEELLKQEAANLKADALVVMDGGNLDVNTGTLTMSTRGIVNLTIEVNTMEKPVHSGIGLAVPDPAMMLAKLMVSLDDLSKVPGALDGRTPLTKAEREILRNDSPESQQYRKEHRLKDGVHLRGDPSDSPYEKITEMHSGTFINGGWGKAGGGNSIQSHARAEYGVRITAGQDPEKVAKSLIDHLENTAKELRIPVTVTQPEKGSFAWKGNSTGPLTQKYLGALKEEFGSAHVQPTGGALPFLHTLQKMQPNMEMIIPGVEDPDCGAHSHNESQDKGLFRKAINAFIGFLKKAGEA